MYPRDSKTFSDKSFVNIDKGSVGGSHWTCFIVKENKPYCFDSFGGQPDKSLKKQLPKTITYHNYKIQDINCKLCSSNCLYFFYLIQRMNNYDAILKMYFKKNYSQTKHFSRSICLCIRTNIMIIMYFLKNAF